MPTPGRRSLRFAAIDEIMPEVERLQQGHTTVGNWSLAEICRHLSSVMKLHLELPVSTQWDPAMRLSTQQRDTIFTTEILPEGLPLPAALSNSEPVDEAEAVERLRNVLARFASSPGPFADHRLLGPLTRDQWQHLHRIHCAHHLSFAIPRPR